MKTTNFIILILFLFLYSCTSSTIEGDYKKSEGSGGVFENQYIKIAIIDKNTYLVKAYDSNHDMEWTSKANLTESDKLIWSDASLPMEINLHRNGFEFKIGNGTFGKYKFSKIENENTEEQYKTLVELKPLLTDGAMVDLPTKIKTLNDAFKVKPSVMKDELHGGTNYEWKICNGEISVSVGTFNHEVIDFIEIFTTDYENNKKYKGLPFNLLINETTLADCEAIFSGYPISDDSSVGFASTTMKVNVKNYWISLYFNDKNILRSITMAKNQYDIK